VVECDVDAPAFGLMALLAVCSQFAGMDVAGAMTAVARCAELLLADYGGMACMTINLCMSTGQRKFRVAIVVKGAGLPGAGAVTAAAIRAQARCVGIFSRVTAVTVLWNLILHATGLVACATVDFCVRAFERKFGFFEMVELCGLPTRRSVALVAFDSAAACVRIVRCVTRYALFGSALVAIAEVTRKARHFGVFVEQRELRLAVIEFGFGPRARFVAAAAIVPQLAVMRIARPMAVYASAGRVAIQFAYLMARPALERRMLPAQWKVGLIVCKRRDVHADDVRIAA